MVCLQYICLTLHLLAICPQLQLADKESTVRAVRRQHFRTLGDHQRMGDDLSR